MSTAYRERWVDIVLLKRWLRYQPGDTVHMRGWIADSLCARGAARLRTHSDDADIMLLGPSAA